MKFVTTLHRPNRLRIHDAIDKESASTVTVIEMFDNEEATLIKILFYHSEIGSKVFSPSTIKDAITLLNNMDIDKNIVNFLVNTHNFVEAL